MKNNKRILFLMINLPIGGAEWVVTNLCNEFIKKGVNVTLVSVKGGVLINELDDRIQVKTFKGKYLPAFMFVYYQLVLRKFDAVFSTQRYCSAILSILHFLSFSNSVLNIRESASNFGYSLQKNYLLRKTFFTFGYRRADNIIANSEATLKSLYNNNIISKNGYSSFIIPNPLDIQGIKLKSDVLINDDIDFNRFTIISIGRLVKHKNMNNIIDVMPMLKKEISDIQLIIIGEGPEKKNLYDLASKLQVHDRVHLLGFKENPYPYLKKSNIFVLASEWEGFGMVVVESLALGTPVIVSDIDSGPKKITQNGKYGALFKIGDIDDLKKNIIDLKKNNKNVNKLTLTKRAEKYNKKNISERYLKVLFNGK